MHVRSKIWRFIKILLGWQSAESRKAERQEKGLTLLRCLARYNCSQCGQFIALRFDALPLPRWIF